jgi:tetratricopeptide (TPR) repeat protein
MAHARTKRRESRKPAAAAPPPRQKAFAKLWPYALAVFVGLFAVMKAYDPALNGPFLFDDVYLPPGRPDFVDQPLRAWLAGVRPMLMFSYWANFRASGQEPFSYHLWNVFFHFANAILVFLIVRKLLAIARAETASPILPGFAAALFLLHPVQTESVAYITGRSESYSVLFFFAAFALFLYRRSTAVSWRVALGILLLFGAAATSKEHTVVLPALLLLTDYFWNPGFRFEGIRRNWRLYVPIGVAGALGTVWVFMQLHGADSAGFGIKGLTWYRYFFTQCSVFFDYIRLFLLPYGQTIDYDRPISQTLLDHGAIFGLVGIVLLIGAAIYFRRRYPLAAYGFLVFIILLAPTSSFVPIKDPFVERRLYLPMIGLLLIIVDGLRRLRVPPKALAGVLAAVLLVAGVLTYQRNQVWSAATPLWEDTIAKNPRNWRAHFQLAYAYYQQGRCTEAVQHYETVAKLEKPDSRLLIDWALAYDCLHQWDPALEKLRAAAKLDPSAHVYSQIGMELAKAGKRTEAMQALDTAVQLDPRFDMTYVYRGYLKLAANDAAGAAAEYRRALSYNARNHVAGRALADIEQRLRNNQ